MTPGPERPEPIQSLVRGLSVITAFGAAHPRMTLSEVAREVDLSRATVRRVLHTLVDLGYAATDGTLFWLTPRTLSLGYSYLSSQGLADLANPHLRALSAALNESTSLAVLDADEIVYTTRFAVRRIMRTPIAVGTRFPAYATSMGRVLLAGMSDADLDDYLARTDRPRLTPNTRTQPDELRRALHEVRRTGIAVIVDELEPGVCSVAAPIVAADGAVVAAINVSMASGSGARERLDAVTPSVLACARAISNEVRNRAALTP